MRKENPKTSSLSLRFLIFVLLFLFSCLFRLEVRQGGEREGIANFTLDWDGKVLLLMADGEYLLKVDTNLLPLETIPLPQRIFNPNKVLANFSYLFITNSQNLFILERKSGSFKKIYSEGEISDFTLSPFGEVVLGIKNDWWLKKIDRFFRLQNFSPSPINPSFLSLTYFGDNLYLLNQKKGEILSYRMGNFQPLASGAEMIDCRFPPYQEGREIFLFSPKGKILKLQKEGKISLVGNFNPLKSFFAQGDFLFLLTDDSQIKKVKR